MPPVKQESASAKSMSAKTPPAKKPSPSETARAARLAEALRENLRRRKSQARERKDGEDGKDAGS